MKYLSKYEARGKFTSYDRYYFDEIKTTNDIYEVINMLVANGYEPTGFQISYENDHASYDEPKKYEDYDSFAVDLPNEILAVDKVSMFYERDGYIGCATICLGNNSVMVSVPVKKNEETMSR